MLDLRSKCSKIETQLRHCLVSFSKTLHALQRSDSTGTYGMSLSALNSKLMYACKTGQGTV